MKKILAFWPKSLHFRSLPFWGSKDPFKNTKCRDLGQKCRDLGKKAGICFFPCILDLDPCLFLAIPAFFAKRQGLEGQGPCSRTILTTVQWHMLTTFFFLLARIVPMSFSTLGRILIAQMGLKINATKLVIWSRVGSPILPRLRRGLP